MNVTDHVRFLSHSPHPLLAGKDDRWLTPFKGSVEIISPFLRVDLAFDWRARIRRFWEFLHQHYRITEDSVSYGTRIYMSHAEGYSKTEYHNLASAIIYFDRVITDLVPVRAASQHRARSVRDFNLKFHGLDIARCVDMIRQTKSLREFLRLWKGHGGEHFSWGFESPVSGMIAFRQAPPSLCANDALIWAELTLNFIQVALHRGDMRAAVEPLEPSDLQAFLGRRRWAMRGLGSSRLLEQIWTFKEDRERARRAERERYRGSPVLRPRRVLPAPPRANGNGQAAIRAMSRVSASTASENSI
jgi:hypothetical protein